MTSKFTTRNSLYMRISKTTVLPTYVYLDHRHVEWMSDKILQHVLADLRPFILPKLRAEKDALTGNAAAQKNSKTTVETHRGDTYQFCYFLRKTEPHSLVLKRRTFVALPPKVVPSETTQGKRTRAAGKETENKRKKRKTAAIIIESDSEQEQDVEMDDATYSPHLEIEEEEEKPKPQRQLRYDGFHIYGCCLCVIVEPWPSLKVSKDRLAGAQAVTSEAEASTSRPVEPTTMPLFLADEEDEAPAQLYTMDEDPDEGIGMWAMSQALQSGGDSRFGGSNEEDNTEVLFGDADEVKDFN